MNDKPKPDHPDKPEHPETPKDPPVETEGGGSGDPPGPPPR